jgi:hypothetical protein
MVSSENLPAPAKSGGANEEVDRRSSDASCAALIVQSSGFLVVGEVCWSRSLLKWLLRARRRVIPRGLGPQGERARPE